MIVVKKCIGGNNGIYYTIINTDAKVHVHTTNKSVVKKIKRCFKQLKKYGFTREKSITVRNSALKLLGLPVVK